MSTKTLALIFMGILLFATVATTLTLTLTETISLPGLAIPRSVKEAVLKLGRPELTVKVFPPQPVNSYKIKVDGETVTLVRVRNTGFGTAKNFTVKLLVDGKTVDEEKIGKLSFLGEKTVEFTWKPEKYGNRTVTVLIDPENRVKEPNEKNNRWTGTVEVEPLYIYGTHIKEPYAKYNITITAKLRCVERRGKVDLLTGKIFWDPPLEYEPALPVRVWGIKIIVPEEPYTEISNLKVAPKPLTVKKVEYGKIMKDWYEKKWSGTCSSLLHYVKANGGAYILEALEAEEYTWIWEGKYYLGDESPQVTVSYILTRKLPDIIADPNKVALADHLKGYVKIIPPETIGDIEDVPKKLKKYTEHLADGKSFFYRAKDPEIVSLAENLTKGKPNAYCKVKAIIEWIRKNIKPEVHTSHDPIDILRSGKADCDGYANLLASMCRAIGIPAIRVGGFMYAGDGSYYETKHTYYGNVSGYIEGFGLANPHAWSLVYLPNYGWVPIDLASGYIAPFTPEKSRNFILNDVPCYPIVDSSLLLAGGDDFSKGWFSYIQIGKVEIKKLE